MELGAESKFTELPTIQQLQKMQNLPGNLHWEHIEANHLATTPEQRNDYHEVLLLPRLQQKLREINLDENGNPWLDERRITQAINQLQRLAPGKLMEKNESFTNILLSGVKVEGLANQQVTINLIDFDHPERNDYLAISQFRVDPPGVKGPQGSHRPDIVLFVNGIPLVVIECKAPGANMLKSGIQDLLKYSNQRNSQQPEGIESLFHYNQLMISCTSGRAVVGTVGSLPKHYLEWKDTTPFNPELISEILEIDQPTLPPEELISSTVNFLAQDLTITLSEKELERTRISSDPPKSPFKRGTSTSIKSPFKRGTSTPIPPFSRGVRGDKEELIDSSKLNRRQQMIAGMLYPANLLNIIRHYTLFTTKQNRRVKIVPRYQQFRAVEKAIYRLQNGQTKAEHGTDDQRGGIIWHYQGSGKSLDMVFILRKLRRIPKLQAFKVVIITDRTELQKQLSETATLSAQNLEIAKNIKDLAKKLRDDSPDIIFGMIQKFRKIVGSEELADLNQLETALNPSPNILLLIDEAHRSHSNTLHSYLLAALPNCAKIGFTGTPIISSQKKKTAEIFANNESSYIDVYSIRDSQKDGVTVPIFYEGLETMGAVTGASTLDALFQVLFADYTPEQQAQIKSRYVKKSDVLKARELMQAKAKHMLMHYVTRIMPGFFKAQLAASDREACVMYQEYLTAAKADLIQELETKTPILQNLKLETAPPEYRNLLQAYPHLDTIKRLEFAAIISADGKKDPQSWKPWTEESNHDDYKNRFWKTLEDDGLAFLIVQNKLLVGFDAPLEQVLYVDRSLKEHDLLQAIARTNRTATGKDYGLIVDYYGIDIAAAMQVYDEKDVEGAWFDVREELSKLEASHRRVMHFWQERELSIYEDQETCVNLLYDELLRAEFYQLLREFLQELDAFLPRPQALPYLKDAKQLGQLKKLIDDIFRDERPEDAKAKVKALIDEHIQSQGIDIKVPPVNILDFNFEQRVQQRHSTKTQAAEMEHAIRYHIRTHLDDDPVYYRQLSEKLEQILQHHGSNWDLIAQEFINLAQQVRSEQTDSDENQNSIQNKIKVKIRPFYNALIDNLESPSPEEQSQILTFVTEIVDFMDNQTDIIGFWNDLVAIKELRNQIWLKLEDSMFFPDSKLDAVSDQITQLARRHGFNKRG